MDKPAKAAAVTEQWSTIKETVARQTQELDMDKQLMENLTDSMDIVNGWIEAGADFTSEQAPLVIQEIVTWGIVDGLIWAFVWAFLIVLIQGACWHFRTILKKWIKMDDSANNKENCEVGILVTWIVHYLAFSFMIGVLFNLYHSLYVYFAPRLYVLETLADLLGSAMGGPTRY